VLDEARAVYPDIIGIIVRLRHGEDAVEAIKRGASDFIQKPFQFDELLHIINAALEQRRLGRERVPAQAARGAVPVRGIIARARR